LKLTEDIAAGRSSLLKVNIIDVDENILNEANRLILHALTYNFGSMDSIIISTANQLNKQGKDICVINLDKSMISAMNCEQTKYNDTLKNIIYSA